MEVNILCTFALYLIEYIMGVKIFAGRASQHMAEHVAKAYGTSLGSVKVNVFSDGEFQPSLEETVRGQDVFIVQSTMPPTENLFE